MKICCESCGHGMFVSDGQLMKLKRMGKKVLCFDCDVERVMSDEQSLGIESARAKWERATFGMQTLDRFCEEETLQP